MAKKYFPDAIKISKTRLNKCGDILRSEKMGAKRHADEYLQALSEVEKWRAAHLYPMNTLKTMLYERTRTCRGKIIAQRLKRMPTIINKLDRFDSMRLSAMQDIGGLRIIVNSVKEVYKLRNSLVKSHGAHKLVREHDYIAEPKKDGYRGIHLIFEYVGTNKTAEEYSGLNIEVQIRTKIQHVWATSVEVAGLATGDKLKNDSGDSKWLEFFRLMSTASQIVEFLDDGGEFIKEQDWDARATYEQLLLLDEREKISHILEGFSGGIKEVDNLFARDMNYYIMMIDPVKLEVKIGGYNEKEYEKAVQKYTELEKQNAGTRIDQVLVSLKDLKTLKKAYPNYFADVSKFIEYLRTIQQGYKEGIEQK